MHILITSIIVFLFVYIHFIVDVLTYFFSLFWNVLTYFTVYLLMRLMTCIHCLFTSILFLTSLFSHKTILFA